MLAWEEFLTQLEEELGDQPVTDWLRPLKVLKFDAANLYLEAKEPFQIHWFEEHVRQKLKDRFVNNNDRPIKVHLSIPSTSSPPPKKDYSPPFSIVSDPLERDFLFEHFLTAPQNLIAHKLLKELASGSIPLGTFNPILVYGPKGSGKTHLLTSLCHALKSSYKVCYVRSETFTEHVVQAIRLSRMKEFRTHYREIDLLVVDDVHLFSKKSATQEEFFHTFNTLHTLGRQILLSANTLPSQFVEIEPRLISRFEWGVTLAIEGKIAPLPLLQQKAALWGLQLAPGVLEDLLEKIPSRPLEALQALALRAGTGKIERAGAEALLRDFRQQEAQKIPTAEELVKVVAAHFGIKSEDILGKSQMREFVHPRQIAMYLCREKLKLPFQKIGELFQRDHSTVMTSVKQIHKQVEEKKGEVMKLLRNC